MRAVVGTILGIVIALAVVTGVRLLAITIHALPGMAVNDPEAMTAWMQSVPLYIFVLYVAAWFLGAFAGGWVAASVARRAGAAWIVAGIALLLSVAGFLQLTYPLWAKAVLIAGPLLGGWLATRLVSAAPAAGPIDG